MNRSPSLIPEKTASSARPQQAVLTQSRSLSLERSRLPFYCLAGFVATQGYLIPLISLPLNWAVWPSLPDIFGVGLVLTVLLFRCRTKMPPFDRGMFKDLLWMGLFFTLNTLLVTIPLSSTGEGVKYGGFTLILFAKYVVVYWAVAHVPLDQKRMRVLHVAALIALLWVSVTMLADRFYLIEIDRFTDHLPRAAAGKWGVIGLDSTVSATRGGTTVVILVLSALAVATAHHRFAWLVEGVVFVLVVASVFLAGSRQGLVRITTFIVIYCAIKPARYIVLVLASLVPVMISFIWTNPPSLEDNPYYLHALERQEILLTDPFSNEGLSGRPDLWRSVLATLDEAPIRWIIGYGMGNYVEYRNAAHNMMLKLLQDGGIIELVWIGILWIRIFRRIWAVRREAWTMVALTASMLTSVFTSAIFYPTLATGWYLGLYFVSLHIMAGNQSVNATPDRLRVHGRYPWDIP